MAFAMRAAATPVSARRGPVACAATKHELPVAIGAAALLSLSAVAPDAAFADIAGLTPCSESKAYAKRLKNEVKGLNKRLKKYEAGSAPAIALEATIQRTNNRFAMYAKTGVLCGADGYPHLIADPGLALRFGHAGEIFIPTIGFLYIAGYIGHVGRKYLLEIRKNGSTSQAIGKEIIIDVPLAVDCSIKGAAWPVEVLAEIKAGTLWEKESNITVSPR